MSLPSRIKYAANRGVGDMIRQVILVIIVGVEMLSTVRRETYCIRNDACRVPPFKLDQNLPDHPMTSPVPARTAVGIRYHVRKRTAWTT